MKKSAQQRLNDAAQSGLNLQQIVVFRRWINSSTAIVEIDGETAHPIRYVENAQTFEDLGDDIDPVAEVIVWFSDHISKITADFESQDQQRRTAVEEERLQREVAIKRQEEAKQRQREAASAARRMTTIVPDAVSVPPQEQERADNASIVAVEPIPNPVKVSAPFDNKDTASTSPQVSQTAHPETRRDSNTWAIMDQIARRLKYRDGEALRARDAKKFEAVENIVKTYRWGSPGRIAVDLSLEGEELLKVANSIYKKVIEPNLGEKGQEELVKRGEVSEKAVEAVTDTMRLRQNVIQHLMNHKGQNFTYNQIASNLGLPWKHVSAALRELATNPANGVLEHEVKVKAKSGTEIAHKVFQYAPERREIDADPGKTDEVVKRVLLRLIGHNPAQSWTSLRVGVRGVLVKVDDKIVDRCRIALLESGCVITKDGPRGAKMHYLVA